MNGQRPQILFLVHRVPYPPNRGDRIRSFHLLKFLAARADVHLAYLCDESPSAETTHALSGLCRDVAAVPLGRQSRWFSAARTVGLGRTATEGLFRSAAMRRVVSHWAQRIRFDAVVVFCSSMVQYLDSPGLKDVPVVVDLVDVDSQKWLDYAAGSRGVRRFLFNLEGRRLRALERALPDRVGAVTLVSQNEADLYRGFRSTGAVHAIPNGVDLDYFRPSDASFADREQSEKLESESERDETCVFVGALDYRANLDGVSWFCERVWPEVRRSRPGARFALVGSRPGAVASRLGTLPGVDLVGQVDDVRPHLRRAQVVVVPLRVARGLQNKVIEALAMGKPVLATPQAIEGLDAVHDVHLHRAATPEEWIEAAHRLFEDGALRRRLGVAGREYVERRHRWDAVLAPFAQLPGLRELNWEEPREADAAASPCHA